MVEFESDHCPVCHKIINVNTNVEVTSEMRDKLGDRIYIPGDDMREIGLTESEEQQRRELEELLRPEDTPEPILIEEN